MNPNPLFDRIEFIDSHTEGEPTRVITSGAPELGDGSVAEKLSRLKQRDWFRKFVILEPRGWDALVGAVLCKPQHEDSAAGVIFINNTGYLGMCGHGAIGVAVTLHHMGRIGLGKHRIETPVGVVEVDLRSANHVAVENVPSYRLLKQVEVDVPELGRVVGDVAWGGNWFFLVEQSPYPLVMKNLPLLSDAANRVRQALTAQGITGESGAEIDHIEFFGPAGASGALSRNFVYCPGGAYDRSPCGTGTSAKVACLAADGKLSPGEEWIQESIIGSHFEATYRLGEADRIIPTISGRAYICSEGTLLRPANDPLRDGIDPQQS
jgi:4-hydroxyproline epimerase